MHLAIEYLYPGIDFLSECVLQDDGDGPYIAAWHRPEAQPTPVEIAAAIVPAQRAETRARINAERNRREQAGFPYSGKWIDSDSVSVQRITVAQATAQMALAAGVPYSVDWACADNSMLALDAMGVLGMMQAFGTYGLALHMHARALKAAVDTSDDPESIDILAGWPE